MNKIYYLGTCSTCQAILKETSAQSLAAKGKIQLQDIKTDKITAAQLDEMRSLSGTYESLFSRRALKYKEMGLKDKVLAEKDYRKLILEEYTFLKRPVTVFNGKVFAGNDKKNVEALKAALRSA